MSGHSKLMNSVGEFFGSLSSKVRTVGRAVIPKNLRGILGRLQQSTFFKFLSKGSKYTSSSTQFIVGRTYDVFLRLKIRAKLSLIVGVSIVATTLIISTIATQIEERELRLQTNTVGLTIVHGLGSVARDNLLLKSYPIIQEYVRNTLRHKVVGLEHLYVVNREGIIVADVQSDSINQQVSVSDFTLLTKSDTTTVYETPDHIRFVQAIYFNQVSEHKRIFLGSCSASFSKAELFAPIDEMKSKILYVSFAVSILAIGLVYFVSKRIVRIIIVLSEAARRVGQGDLKVTVVTRIQDELGMLARDFNLMVLQIREKTEMQKFVSKSTMEIIAGGHEATLGGVRQPITAMFTDIRGFTSFSEKHSPEEVIEILNLYLDVQTQIIQNHNGVVDKFLGDGIMSVFTGEHQTENAIEAAIHIQRELTKMNHRRKSWKDKVLEVGIGISAGDAVLGSIGSMDRMDYTAIGDTVNLASRVCGVAAPGQIMVTEGIVQSIDGRYKPRSEGNFPIKGKEHQVPLYQIPYQSS
ncbi:MAG TPA: adenylate/guanylate cyclase domain-containing protein [Bacteroidota bacterium]